MIAELLTITDAAYGAALPVTTRHVFAQLLNGVPVVHAGGGQFTPVANDLNGSWSYQRIRGNVDVSPTSIPGSPCQGVRVLVPLRIVALLPRDTCMESAEAAMAALRNTYASAAVAIGANEVRFDRVSWAFAESAAGEFSPAPQIPTSKALLIIDLSIAVIATQECITGCDPVDVTCSIIAAASVAKLRECLGDRLNDICGGGGGDCDLCTEVAKETSTPEAIVDCITDAGKVDGVRDLLCDPTIVNGIVSETNVITVLQGGDQIGVLDPETGIVVVDECRDATVQLRDSEGNDIGAPQSCPSGSTNILTAPDGIVNVNSVPFVAVPSAGSINVPVKDGTGTLVGARVGNEWIVPTRPPDGDAIIYRFGTILASGQTTVYRAGDEGTMQASGFFDYSPTIGPNSVLQDIVGFGTGGNWTTLKFNNSFGNTLRFTDRSGGAAASSGNRFIIDHLTNLEYYVLGSTVVAASWDAAVDAGVAINATLGETGWFLPNDRVLDSITNDASSAFISDPPFSISAGGNLWTSSTSPGSTTAAKFLSISGGQIGAATKTTNTYSHGIYVRRRP